MKNLNQNYHYKRDLFRVANADKACDNWVMGAAKVTFSAGNSSTDSEDYFVTTDYLKISEIPDKMLDAASTAELICELLNLYYRGELFVGDPNQTELFNKELK